MGKKPDYTDVSNAVTQQNFLTAEEFPEGTYGAPFNKTKPVSNKDTPWKDGQQFYTNSSYEYRTFHENLPRQFPGAHPTHDKKGVEKVPPYNNYTPD